MLQPTKFQRHLLYKRVLKAIEYDMYYSHYNKGLCNYIANDSFVLENNWPNPHFDKQNWPEFVQQKPSKIRGTWWWSRTRQGHEARVRALKRAIALSRP